MLAIPWPVARPEQEIGGFPKTGAARMGVKGEQGQMLAHEPTNVRQGTTPPEHPPDAGELMLQPAVRSHFELEEQAPCLRDGAIEIDPGDFAGTGEGKMRRFGADDAVTFQGGGIQPQRGCHGSRPRRLPDRTPIKLAITITPDLQNALQAYAALYTAEYGIEEPLTELIPAMLAAFLESDRNFSRARSGRIG